MHPLLPSRLSSLCEPLPLAADLIFCIAARGLAAASRLSAGQSTGLCGALLHVSCRLHHVAATLFPSLVSS